MKALLDYVGIPYAIGASPPKGADCWTLAKDFALNVLGQHWPDYLYDVNNVYDSASRQIVAQMANLGGRWERMPSPQYGCILIMRMKGIPIHCAVMVSDTEMLHTLSGRDSCIEPVERWRHNLLGAYKWKGK